MWINGVIYCDECCLFVGDQKRATVKKPGCEGNQPDHYRHYHRLDDKNCYAVHLAKVEDQQRERISAHALGVAIA